MKKKKTAQQDEPKKNYPKTEEVLGLPCFEEVLLFEDMGKWGVRLYG